MAHSRSTTPSWHASKLAKAKRKHQACFADLLGIPPSSFPAGKFELLADDCYENHWLAYEGDCRGDESPEYVGLRHYFVDEMLGVAITTRDESHYITYFHEHFDSRHGVRPPPTATVGQRILEYRSRFETDKHWKIRSVKVLSQR